MKKVAFLFLMILLFAPKSAKAVQLNIYNGEDTGGSNPSRGSCSDAYKWSYFCQSNGNGSRTDGVRVTIVHYGENGYEKIGNPVDIWPEKYNFSNVKYGGNSKTDLNSNSSLSLNDYGSYGSYVVWNEKFWLDDRNQQSGVPEGNKKYWEDKLKEGSTDASGNVIKDSVIDQISKIATNGQCSLSEGSSGICASSGSSSGCWNLFSEEADPSGGGIDKKGYRIIIEPVREYFGKNGDNYIMTPSELAATIMNTGYINANGKPASQAQTNKLLTEGEFFNTTFDDIGIKSTANCRNRLCTTDDFLSAGNGSHIIDFSDILPPCSSCDYETGAGLPPAGASKGDLGRDLTEEEKQCCNEVKDSIKEIIDIKVDETQCMDASKTVPEYVTCMQNYFIFVQQRQGLLSQQQQLYKELYEKYPACGCDYDGIDKINKDYNDCVTSGNVSEWISSLMSGVQTSCEIDRTSSISEFYTYNSKELCGSLLPDCPFEECPWDPKNPNPDDPNNPENPDNPTPPGPGVLCDENDPNSFPKTGTANEAEKYCCYEFEAQQKLKYEIEGLQQGLRDTALQEYVKAQVEAWFSEKEFRIYCLEAKCDINIEENFSEDCCKELMEAYPDKEKYPYSFWIEKGCTPPDPNPCKWEDYTEPLLENLISMKTSDCTVSTSKVAKDTDKWEDCIFESDNLTGGGLTEQVFKDYYIKYSNPYCAVYCREEVKYDFPGSEIEVKAGHHFTVGSTSGHTPNWSPIHFQSVRQCKTSGSTTDNNSKYINTTKFERDWEIANYAVISAWDSWKIEEDIQYSINNSTVLEEESEKCKECVETETDEETGETTCVKYVYYDLMEGEQGITYKKFKAKNATNASYGKWCSNEKPRANVAEARRDYRYAVAVLETIEDDISACTDWNHFGSYRHTRQYEEFAFDNENIKADRYAKYETYNEFKQYNEFNPDLKLDYKEPTYSGYNYSGLLDYKEETKIKNDNFDTQMRSKTNKYNCPTELSAPNLETCEDNEIFDYSVQSESHANYEKNIYYELKKDVFNTILKPQGIAVNNDDVQSSTQIKIKLGYGALHVHFMTPSGVYGKGEDETGQLDLSYEKFTSSDLENKFDHNFDHEEFGVKEYFYDCDYKVVNEIIENKDPECVGDNCLECTGSNCDPNTLKGLNLIYRPISLGSPFPGIEGEGRAPGSNWSNNKDIETYITKNRGVEGTKIYSDKLPMYQVTLTPALIQQIRKYNRTTTYNDFNMDCTASGRECKSHFIRETVDEYDFSKQFEKCSKAANKEEATCCGIGNWNECDNIDEISRKQER